MTRPVDMGEEVARAHRMRRWMALDEDAKVFGLTPAEQAEFDQLDREFSGAGGERRL